jgi:hypothetical protein
VKQNTPFAEVLPGVPNAIKEPKVTPLAVGTGVGSTVPVFPEVALLTAVKGYMALKFCALELIRTIVNEDKSNFLIMLLSFNFRLK